MANEKSRAQRAREAVTAAFTSFRDNVISPIWSFVTAPFRFVGRVLGFTKPEASADTQAPQVETPAQPTTVVETQPRFPRISNFFAGLSNPFAGIGTRISSLFKTDAVKKAEEPQQVEQPQAVESEEAKAQRLAAEETERLKQEELAQQPVQSEVALESEEEKKEELAQQPVQPEVTFESEEAEAIRLAAEEAERLKTQATTATPTTPVVEAKTKAANDSKRQGVVARLDSARKGLGLTGYKMHKAIYGEKAKETAAAVPPTQETQKVEEQRQGSGSKLRLGGSQD